MAGAETAKQMLDQRAVALALSLPGAAGVALLPFLVIRPNRIVGGEPLYLWEVSGGGVGVVIFIALIGLALLPVVLPMRRVRVMAPTVGIVAILYLAGLEAQTQLAEAGEFARISLGGGFWIALAFFGLTVADGLMRLALGPAARLLLVTAVAAALLFALQSDGSRICPCFKSSKRIPIPSAPPSGGTCCSSEGASCRRSRSASRSVASATPRPPGGAPPSRS